MTTPPRKGGSIFGHAIHYTGTMPRERPQPVPDDRQLAEAAGRREAWAEQHLARRLLERVRNTVYYLAAGDRDADDLVQLSLVEILRSASAFRGESALETWADRIVVRTALRQLRQRRRRESPVALEELPLADPFEPQAHLRQRELQRRLAAHLEHLKPERRAVMVLHWVLGHTVEEVAALTDAPPNTVRKRLRVGKRQLRKRLRNDPVFLDWLEGSDATPAP